MAKGIKHLKLEGLHGWLNLDVDFSEGINVFYGRNGSGKTTLLHVIANILGADIVRFLALRFDCISMEFSEGQTIVLKQKILVDQSFREVECFLNDKSVGAVRGTFEPKPMFEPDPRFYARIRRTLREAMSIQPTYFPAFRSILEAATQVERLTEEPYDVLRERTYRYGNVASSYERPTSRQTDICRRLFGNFIPDITYPSLKDVEQKIESEIGEAMLKVATANRQLFSRIFSDSLDAVMGSAKASDEQPETILAAIDDLLQQLDEPEAEAQATYSALTMHVNMLKTSVQKRTSETVSEMLMVYKKALEERLEAQKKAFDPLQRFLDSVNSFLEKKQLTINRLPEETATAHRGRRRQPSMVQLENGKRTTLDTLSSGERQIVCLIYSATHIGGADSVVLIDEPELSLHIDWQRRLLTEMQQQMGAKQIIVCTHSPDIGEDHDEAVRILDTHPIMVQGTPTPEDEADSPFSDEADQELDLLEQ